MFNPFKVAALCALLPIGLMTSGCSMGIGEAGADDVLAGNWTAAKQDFNEDYRDNPEHPIAIFNMGTAYRHDDNLDRSTPMFSEAAVKGRGYVPDGTLEPISSGKTVAEHACSRLHRDNKVDPNCGDRIAAEMPPAPPPAPIAQAHEPAPAVEAEAATPTPRKQDRN